MWELRNPVMTQLYIKAVFNMHTRSGAAEAVQSIKAMDPNNLSVDLAIDEWGPAVIQRIAKIRQKLNVEVPGHQDILSKLQLLEETYLKPGYQEVMKSLVTRDKIVLAHNDAQENNILCSLQENEQIVLIDYEYGLWNPAYYDVANYLNEFVLDNAYP